MNPPSLTVIEKLSMADIISVGIENTAGVATHIVFGHVFDGQSQQTIGLHIDQETVRGEELLVVLEPLHLGLRIASGASRELGNHALVDIAVADLLQEYWRLRARMFLAK